MLLSLLINAQVGSWLMLVRLKCSGLPLGKIGHLHACVHRTNFLQDETRSCLIQLMSLQVDGQVPCAPPSRPTCSTQAVGAPLMMSQ